MRLPYVCVSHLCIVEVLLLGIDNLGPSFLSPLLGLLPEFAVFPLRHLQYVLVLLSNIRVPCQQLLEV